MKEVVDIDTLRKLLSYNPETGDFTWNERAGDAVLKGNFNSQFAGRLAGTRDSQGYVQIAISVPRHRIYRAHRLAWAYVFGVWPKLIDHIDGNKSNNAISNLRIATQRQNTANQKRRRTNTSGFKGVRWDPRMRKWASGITVNGKTIHLGFFASPEDAHAAYAVAAVEYNGEFARAV